MIYLWGSFILHPSSFSLQLTWFMVNSGSIQPIDNSQKSLVLSPVRGFAQVWHNSTTDFKSSS